MLACSRMSYGFQCLQSSLLLALCFFSGCTTVSRSVEPALTQCQRTITPPNEIRPAMIELVSLQIGLSAQGTPIEIQVFRSSNRDAENVLLFAGIHGNEQSTVGVMKYFAADLQAAQKSGSLALDFNIHVVPLANPDGFALRTRTNASKVDLNRNFPAKNWKSALRKTSYWNGPSPLSEPESRALHDLVLTLQPIRILSLHSIKAGRHGNNFDGPANELAQLLASKNGYAVLPTMGYPTPGSFGSWAGVDLQIPTITLELPANISADAAWKQNREALWAFVRGK